MQFQKLKVLRFKFYFYINNVFRHSIIVEKHTLKRIKSCLILLRDEMNVLWKRQSGKNISVAGNNFIPFFPVETMPLQRERV